jgi:hypothetical protein
MALEQGALWHPGSILRSRKRSSKHIKHSFVSKTILHHLQTLSHPKWIDPLKPLLAQRNLVKIISFNQANERSSAVSEKERHQFPEPQLQDFVVGSSRAYRLFYYLYGNYPHLLLMIDKLGK